MKAQSYQKIIATFVWKKSPKQSISFFIYEPKTIKIIYPPHIYYLISNLKFKKNVKIIIRDFFLQFLNFNPNETKIILEFKIVFKFYSVPYIKISKESRFVYKTFQENIKKYANKFDNLIVKPQLRRALSKVHLKNFKRELRKLALVSRKKTSGFEYYLWMVGLHATQKTYKPTLKKIRNQLLDAFWNEP